MLKNILVVGFIQVGGLILQKVICRKRRQDEEFQSQVKKINDRYGRGVFNKWFKVIVAMDVLFGECIERDILDGELYGIW